MDRAKMPRFAQLEVYLFTSNSMANPTNFFAGLGWLPNTQIDSNNFDSFNYDASIINNQYD